MPIATQISWQRLLNTYLDIARGIPCLPSCRPSERFSAHFFHSSTSGMTISSSGSRLSQNFLYDGVRKIHKQSLDDFCRSSMLDTNSVRMRGEAHLLSSSNVVKILVQLPYREEPRSWAKTHQWNTGYIGISAYEAQTCSELLHASRGRPFIEALHGAISHA